MIARLAFFALLLFVFSGCETEVDLNAPYKSYTTVYGLLDLSADTQVVRINKSFLGPGSALDFAQVPDSSEYNPEDVEAYIEWGNNVVQLQPHTIPNRDPGVFYDEDIMVFITDEDLLLNATGSPINLNSQSGQLVSEYKLVVKVPGKEITGVTAPVYFTISNITGGMNNSNYQLPWAQSNEVYPDRLLTITSVPSGVRYEARIIFHFKEYLTNQDVIDRAFEFKLGGREVPLGSGGLSMDFVYNAETIFSFLANNLECEGTVAYREIQDVEFMIDVAGEDLSRYMTINNPVTGIVTERPDFSNIEGEDAIGLFSSRYKFSFFRALNSVSREVFHTGEITGQLCFCNPAPGSSYPCPSSATPCPCN